MEDGARNHRPHGLVRRLFRAGDEERLPARDDALGNGGDSGRALAEAEDHFGEALPELPVRVDTGEPEILERRRPERRQDLAAGGRRIESAAAYAIDERFELL